MTATILSNGRFTSLAPASSAVSAGAIGNGLFVAFKRNAPCAFYSQAQRACTTSRLHAAAILVAFAFASGVASAQMPRDGATAEERAKLDEESVAAKEARAHMTPAQKRAANAEKQRQLEQLEKYSDNDGHALDLTPAPSCKIKGGSSSSEGHAAEQIGRAEEGGPD